MKIHVWVPDFTGATGGIQTFSRFLVKGLNDCGHGLQLRVFAKNDISAPSVEDRLLARFGAVGTWPARQRTAAFTSKLLLSAYRDRPDLIIVVHVNFAPVAHWLHKLMGIPFIVIGHGVEIWSHPGPRIAAALRHATRLYAVSNFTRERMAAVLGISSDRIELLPNTFDPNEFTLGPKPRFLVKRYGLRADQPVVLTIARLESAERYKGYDQVLRAIALVRQSFPEVRYLLGGRGPDRQRVTDLVAQFGLSQTVILAGFIPTYELAAHYNLCSVFAMPSKGEGFGIVFLEALSCGKPVVAGNRDGSVDAVLNGKLGILVDPDNVNEIASAIIQILSGQGEGKGPTRKIPHSMSNNGDRELIYQPDKLRQEVMGVYGYPQFVKRLDEIVTALSRR
jgi:glycosyltransferase involved in cell wall biosynthesis